MSSSGGAGRSSSAPVVTEPIYTFGLRADYYLFSQLCISIWISICNGSIFIFGLMSPYLKEAPFNFDQRSVAIVATTGSVLSYISLPTGYLFDNYGPKPTLLVGGAVSVIGWISMYFVFAYHLSTSVFAVACTYGIAQISASFYETGSLLTNLESFRCQQGRIVILQKTFMGLGSSLIATYYSGFFAHNDNLPGFLMFLALLNLFWSVLGAHTIKLPGPGLWARGLNIGLSGGGADAGGASATTTSDGRTDAVLDTSASESKPLELSATSSRTGNGGKFRSDILAEKSYDKAFRIGFACLAATIILLTAAGLATTFDHISQTGETIVAVIALFMPFSFWLMITAIPKVQPTREESEEAAKAVEEANEAPAAVAADRNESGDAIPNNSSQQGASAAPVISYVPPGYTLNRAGLETNMKTLELWLMWFCCLCVWGAGTVVTANGAQIYKALAYDNYSKQENDVLVSIYGVASACGRVIVGAAHPMLLKRNRHVSALYPIAPAIMAVAMPLYIILPAKALLLTFGVTGLAQGFSWGTTVLLMKALFTPNNCGKHYAILYTAGMLTPLLFSVGMFAGVYDHYSEVQGRTDTHDCKGTVCIASPLLVMMGLNIAAFCAAFVFYVKIKAKKGLIPPSSS